MAGTSRSSPIAPAATKSRALFYTAADKRLYRYSVADGKTAVIASDTVARIGKFAISPDSRWVAFTKQARPLRAHANRLSEAMSRSRQVYRTCGNQ